MQNALKSTGCAALKWFEERNFEDIDEQAVQLPGYDQQYQQLSSGQYEGVFCTIEATNDYSIYIEETNQVLAQQGSVPKDSFSLGILLDCNSDTPCMLDAVPLKPNDIFLLTPGAEYDFRTAPSMQICIVNIPSEYLIDSVFTEDRIPTTSVIPGDSKLVESISLFIKASVDRFRTTPGILAQSGSIDAFQSTVTSMISWYLTLALESKRLSCHQELGLFRKARDLMHSDLRENISISSICSELHIGRRTLEKSFANVCGLGPARYFKLVKLNEVRRELLRTDRASDRIGDIVAEWNIWNLGRFAGEYYSIFGEKPSDTRNRIS